MNVAKVELELGCVDSVNRGGALATVPVAANKGMKCKDSTR